MEEELSSIAPTIAGDFAPTVAAQATARTPPEFITISIETAIATSALWMQRTEWISRKETNQHKNYVTKLRNKSIAYQ